MGLTQIILLSLRVENHRPDRDSLRPERLCCRPHFLRTIHFERWNEKASRRLGMQILAACSGSFSPLSSLLARQGLVPGTQRLRYPIKKTLSKLILTMWIPCVVKFFICILP